MINYCKKTGLRVCYDLCHSQLFCNVKELNLVDEIKNIEDFVDHFHLSDADGIDGEGLQYGEGTMNFKEIIPILNKHVEKSFAIEVWKGHENGGIGFKKFLDEIVENGLMIN
jgi:N-acetylneuraminate synthase